MGLLCTRLAGFLAGGSTAGALYVSTKVRRRAAAPATQPARRRARHSSPPPQRLVWHKTAALAEAVPGAPLPTKQPAAAAPALLGADVRAALARRWNAGVDAAFRPVIRFLADRDL
jgi:hypothetical protein